MLHPWIRQPFWLASAAAISLAAACDMPADTPAQRRSDPPKVYVETPFGATPPGGSGQAPAATRGSRFLVGDGRPFTVTGSIPCATTAAETGRACSFGAVRSSPGNADAWVALGEGVERHVVFANGEPVRSNGGQVTVERSEGRYKIRIGSERFEIPEAAIMGPPAPGTAPARPTRRRAAAPAAKTEPSAPAPSAPAPEPASPSGSADPAPAPPPAAPSEP